MTDLCSFLFVNGKLEEKKRRQKKKKKKEEEQLWSKSISISVGLNLLALYLRNRALPLLFDRCELS